LLQSPTKVLSAQDKVIRRKQNKIKTEADVRREIDLLFSIIQTIWKNTTKIVSALVQNGSRKKRLLKSEGRDVDDVKFTWFRQDRSDIVTLSGQIFMIIFVPHKF
jgi:predicted Zn-dependent protease